MCIRDRFRGHYLLFHVLYRLRDRLAGERLGRLRVDPLSIVLEFEALPCDGTALAPGEPDFAPCYADLARLATVTITEVAELLRHFHAARRRDERRRAALAVLDLRDPIDAAAIKRRYRRLAMRHHPDRGGDGRRLGEINAALVVLEEELDRCV